MSLHVGGRGPGHLVRSGGAFYPTATTAVDFQLQQYRNGAGTYSVRDLALLTGWAYSGGIAGRYEQMSSGLVVPFAANVAPIVDLGLANWIAATTIQPKSRRLDDGTAWTLSNMTASAVQGNDGVAASATRLTATGANATCLGTAIVSASAARRLAPYIRRVSGTGNIDLTLDGGSTWTKINGITSIFQRLGIGQTLANPKVGVRIASSGDSVDIDFANGESSAFDTSPLESGAANITRAADAAAISGVSLPSGPWTLFGQALLQVTATGFQGLVAVDDGVAGNNLIQLVATSTQRPRVILVQGGATTYDSGGAGFAAFVPPATLKMAASYDGTSITAQAQSVSLGASAAGSPTTATNRLALGVLNGGAQPTNGYIQRVALYPSYVAGLTN